MLLFFVWGSVKLFPPSWRSILFICAMRVMNASLIVRTSKLLYSMCTASINSLKFFAMIFLCRQSINQNKPKSFTLRSGDCAGWLTSRMDRRLPFWDAKKALYDHRWRKALSYWQRKVLQSQSTGCFLSIAGKTFLISIWHTCFLFANTWCHSIVPFGQFLLLQAAGHSLANAQIPILPLNILPIDGMMQGWTIADRNITLAVCFLCCTFLYWCSLAAQR